MTDLLSLDIRGLRAACTCAATTPVEILAQHLARIERLDPSLRAFVAVDADRALRAAEESGRRYARGDARALEGVPIGIKANIAVAGMEWHAGMAARRGLVSEADAEAVARLRGAGAIILGTLNMHEAALGATTDNPWFGRTSNPHCAGYTPGGSSGGSGAAVAAGLCVAALGSDTLGSVRIPAAYTGVYAMKPSPDGIPTAGLVPVSDAFDCIGPLARSIDDLESVLAAAMRAERTRPEPRRLLVLDSFVGIRCEPAVSAAYERALGSLKRWPMARLALPDAPESIRAAAFVMVTRELNERLRTVRVEYPESLSPELTFMLSYAENRSPTEVAEAENALARTRTALRAAIATDGVLLTPTTPQAAFVHTPRPPATQATFTALASIAGLPALSLPAGVNADGLPVGVQLIGAPGSEPALLELGRALDADLAGYVAPSLS